MQQFETPEFKVNSSRFGDIAVRTSYAENTISGDGPTAFASVQGNAKNFICTAGSVSVLYDPCDEDHSASCKGIVRGYAVTEKWGDDVAYAEGATLIEAVSNFGIAIAALLR